MFIFNVHLFDMLHLAMSYLGNLIMLNYSRYAANLDIKGTIFLILTQRVCIERTNVAYMFKSRRANA